MILLISPSPPRYTPGKEAVFKKCRRMHNPSADWLSKKTSFKEKLVVIHTRKWEKNLRIDLPAHEEQGRKLRKRILMNMLIPGYLAIAAIVSGMI